MNAFDIARTVSVLAFACVVAGLAGCGGGGSPPPPGPTGPTLGPGASSVTSSDGKVTVAVGDNALQSAVSVSVVPATPDASTAAEPSYVPGTTYTYSAPELQVPEQVMITIESPLAVAADGASAQAAGRKHALALPPGYFPPPTCLVNQPGPLSAWQPVKNILVQGTECPAAPAPGCQKIYQFGTGAQQQALCAPVKNVIVVPATDYIVCPEGYVEVTADPFFADIAAAHGNGRICQRYTVQAPPVLADRSRGTSVNCQVGQGKFLCPAPKLPSGTYSVLWDKTPPPDPTIDLANQSSGIGFSLEENGPPAMINVRLKADDPDGIGGMELLELLPFVPNSLDAANGELPVAVRWRAPTAPFKASKVTHYDSGVFQIPYAYTDPAKRRFRARVFDRAGNSTDKNSSEVLQGFFNKISVDSFTVTPSSVQFPGGPVTLSWAVKGAGTVSIDNGGGTVTVNDNPFSAATGSVSLDVSATTTFTLTATHPTRLTRTAVATVTLGADATPPTVSLAAAPAALVAPGSTTLTATASDNAGVTKVEFFRGAALIGTDSTAPFTQAVAFTPADIGTAAFTAKAYDAANNSTTSTVVNVTVNADTTAPTVALLANPATVLVPGATTLQATASDNIGVSKVEFWRGTTLLATDTAAPFQTTLNLTSADLGTVTFTAKAYDAQNNVTTSAPADVLATTPSTGDTYASPTGVDAGNTTCAQANPCRSIAQAAATAQANKTVWLMNGTFDTTTQPAPISIPAGLTLRALTPGLAGVGQQIVLQGSATVVGVVLRRNGFGDFGSLAASAGNVTIDGVKATGSANAGSGYPAVLVLSGTVHATMTPGNIVDYADQLSPAGQGVAIYATLAGNAWLTVNGGLFGGAALGGSDGVYGAFNRGAFHLVGSSRLDLNNVVLNVDSSGIFLYGDATQAHLTGTLLNAGANSGPGFGIYAAKGTPQVTLVNSTISGFDYGYSHNSTGIYVGTFAQPGVALTLTTTNSGVTQNNVGVYVTEIGSSPSSLAWTGTNTSVAINTHGGIACHDACSIDLSGGELSENATNDALASGVTFHGGVWMGMANKAYNLKLRNMIIVGNQSSAGSNANSSDNSGVTMAGNASSVFDLGTAASPGNNLLQANTSSAQTSSLNVNVAAGVTVSAVGNTFAANVQGANSQGKYQLGTAPCGGSSCNLTSGSGANYRIGSGTLRLAQ